MNEFFEKFKVQDLQILVVNEWIISLRPQQITLGSLVLSLSRPCDNLGDLTENESKNLGLAFNRIKELYDLTFKPDKINYLALMMVDNQVHFHIIPRYNKSLMFKDNVYVDVDWPKPANIFSNLDLAKSQLYEVKDYLKSHTTKL